MNRIHKPEPKDLQRKLYVWMVGLTMLAFILFSLGVLTTHA